MPREFGIPLGNEETPLTAWWHENADWVPIPNALMIDVAEHLNTAYDAIALECGQVNEETEARIRLALRLLYRSAGDLMNRVHNQPQAPVVGGYKKRSKTRRGKRKAKHTTR